MVAGICMPVDRHAPSVSHRLSLCVSFSLKEEKTWYVE